MNHELKTWPEPFDSIWEGKKLHEVRSTVDRQFSSGDTVTLRRWHPKSKTYSGRRVVAHIGYVTAGGEWGIPDGLCVFSLLNIFRTEGP